MRVSLVTNAPHPNIVCGHETIPSLYLENPQIYSNLARLSSCAPMFGFAYSRSRAFLGFPREKICSNFPLCHFFYCTTPFLTVSPVSPAEPLVEWFYASVLCVLLNPSYNQFHGVALQRDVSGLRWIQPHLRKLCNHPCHNTNIFPCHLAVYMAALTIPISPTRTLSPTWQVTSASFHRKIQPIFYVYVHLLCCSSRNTRQK